jgi:hypothetical protein
MNLFIITYRSANARIHQLAAEMLRRHNPVPMVKFGIYQDVRQLLHRCEPFSSRNRIAPRRYPLLGLHFAPSVPGYSVIPSVCLATFAASLGTWLPISSLTIDTVWSASILMRSMASPRSRRNRSLLRLKGAVTFAE